MVIQTILHIVMWISIYISVQYGSLEKNCHTFEQEKIGTKIWTPPREMLNCFCAHRNCFAFVCLCKCETLFNYFLCCLNTSVRMSQSALRHKQPEHFHKAKYLEMLILNFLPDLIFPTEYKLTQDHAYYITSSGRVSLQRN